MPRKRNGLGTREQRESGLAILQGDEVIESQRGVTTVSIRSEGEARTYFAVAAGT